MSGHPPPWRLTIRQPSPPDIPKICDCPILKNEESLDDYFIFESTAPLTQGGGFGFVVGAIAKPAFEKLVNETFAKIQLKSVDLGMRPVVIKEVKVSRKSALEEVKQETRMMRYLMLLRERDADLRGHLPGYYGCFTALKDNLVPVAYLVMDRILGAPLVPPPSPFDALKLSPFDPSKLSPFGPNANPHPKGKSKSRPLIGTRNLGLAKPVEVFDLLVEYNRNNGDKEALRRLCNLVFKPLAKIIARLHSHGVVHGDVKPSNLMFGHTGASSSEAPSPTGVYLIDFGHTCLNPARIKALKLTSYPPCTKHSLSGLGRAIWRDDFSSIDVATRSLTAEGHSLRFDHFERDDWWGVFYSIYIGITGASWPSHHEIFEAAAVGSSVDQRAESYRDACLTLFKQALERHGLTRVCPWTWKLMELIGGSAPLEDIQNHVLTA
jgi:serine/threonine protein kinase